ncbi:ribosomal protein L14E/L6E/L27E [Pantoea agglomerans]|jgi:ribosomal protein L14E/L6E/L27E|nr:helix-turn-helix domain-containing protein [Pantoea agglomerans]NEG84761.1 helix-turn-helix domain-containing protein [Pantoea agglomerans]NEH06776.1 helix-turn-helix domain-containing protein [Pantoea agglomerans]
MIYIIEPIDENICIAGEKSTVNEYPDSRIAFRYAHRLRRYQVFDRLACVDQDAIVDNKRLGAVLRLALEKQDGLEAEVQRSRSKKMPRRRVLKRALKEPKATNWSWSALKTLFPTEAMRSFPCPLWLAAIKGGYTSEDKSLRLLRGQLRADVIEAHLARDISLDEAAESMELNHRQCRRLVELYREGGPEELINKRHGGYSMPASG